MSISLYSGRRQDAKERLKATSQVAPAAFRVAACEATMGLYMEAGQVYSKSATSTFRLDINTSVSPDNLVDISIKDDNIKWSEHNYLKFWVNAIKGLIALLNGESESENVVLSYGEYLHCLGDFPSATQMYERVLEALSTQNMSGKFLSACNMIPEEVSLGATCSYGQLLSHSGKFNEAEDYLTRALKKAEEKFGANHPKVGIVLTCVARMYKLKSKIGR
uniref:Kinesin light chain n=1 Tax=Oryza brachyantha TaxID=4533 RepID=J3M4Q9_ORYBR